MRLVDHLANRTREIADRMHQHQINGYDIDDVGAAARDAAAVWERILKASERDWAAKRTPLYDMAEELARRGWPHEQALHTIRRVANMDKHDASRAHDFDVVLRALNELADAAVSLTSQVPSISDPAPEQLRRRHMVCAIYDYFAQGETEYAFLAATKDDTWRSVREIDSFQINNSHSRAVEAALAKLDDWTIDPPELGDLRASLKESDQELYRLGAFTSSYQDVLDLMAPYQHDRPLLAGLHREDRTLNVVASTVAASIRGEAAPRLTGRSPRQEEVVQRVMAWLDAIPYGIRPRQLDRCDASTFASEAGQAVLADHELGILVKRDGLVLVIEYGAMRGMNRGGVGSHVGRLRTEAAPSSDPMDQSA